MNCQDFQNQLYEYVEGSLSADAQAEGDKHLAECHTCQQAVSQEQQRARFLFNRLQQDTKTLVLGPEIRRRILSAPQRQPGILWNRFAWPMGVAASLLLIVAILPVKHSPGAPPVVSIEVSYRVPTCKFRQQGNLVLDSSSFETVVVSDTLWSTK